VPANLADTLQAVFGVDPSAPVLEFEEAWSTWGQIDAARAQVADALREAGVGPGARVGIMLRNRAELVAPILEAAIGGHCLVTINPSYPDERLIEDLEKLDAPVLIASSKDWARPAVAEAALASGALCLEMSYDLGVRIRRPVDPGRLAKPSAYAPGVGVEMLTSGTTGTPKRIPFPASNFEAAVLGAAIFEGDRSGEAAPRLRGGVQIIVYPTAHISGLLAVFNTLVAGRKICLLERFQVEPFMDAIRRHRPKVVQTAPAAIKMVLDADVAKDDLASLSAWRTGSAPLDLAVAEAFQDKYDLPILQNYGATEFGGVAGWTMADFRSHWAGRKTSVGRLNPGVEGRVIDPQSGEVLAAGESGVLELRGPQIGTGGAWMRTTDIAVLDAESFLWIKGRSDNAIMRGGFKIQPDDIVRALEEHPDVLEAAVAALPDERLGQVPVAGCILKRGAERCSADDLLAHLRARLLPYQVPTRLLVVDELPRTESMKVSQPRLRELFLENRPSSASHRP